MEDLEVRLRALQEERSNLKSLLEHPGWKWLDSLAEQQITNRMPSILTRTESLLEVTGSEFDKGEIAGIQLFRQIAGITIQSLEEEIEQLEKDLSYDDGERTGVDGDGDATDGEFEPAV